MKKTGLLYILILLIITGCSSIERVKWGSVDLFGNEITVRKITAAIAGNSGTVKWAYGEKSDSDGMDLVVATIRKGNDESMLHFIYDNINMKCRLVNFEKNGEAMSPFMIYKYLGKNR
jgi:hypothetical protein